MAVFFLPPHSYLLHTVALVQWWIGWHEFGYYIFLSWYRLFCILLPTVFQWGRWATPTWDRDKRRWGCSSQCLSWSDAGCCWRCPSSFPRIGYVCLLPASCWSDPKMGYKTNRSSTRDLSLSRFPFLNHSWRRIRWMLMCSLFLVATCC